MTNNRNFGLIAGLALVLAAAPHQALAAGFEVFHAFQGTNDGEYPEGGLIADSYGNLYGTTFGSLESGGPGKKCPKNCGSVYGFDESGTQTFHYFFNGDNEGAFPTGEALLEGTTLYGTTEYGPKTGCGGLGCGTVYQIQSDGSKDTIVSYFCMESNCTDGVFPHGALIADQDGTSFFGITILGGTGAGWLCGSDVGGCGTVFQYMPNGDRSVLYSFCSLSRCKDGAVPFGKLLQDKKGNLYGTTQFGGTHSRGTIFRLKPPVHLGDLWTEKVLYSFCADIEDGICADGAVPEAGLIADEAGNLYGTTTFGGENVTTCSDDLGCGVIFKLAPDGTYIVLHPFVGGTDGGLPQSALVADSAGNLYGTTLRGGGGGTSCANHVPTGCGTVFMLASDGSVMTLHAFGRSDGVHPEGSLLLLDDRYLYGATRESGKKPCACGTLYRLDLQAAMTAQPPRLLGLPPNWRGAGGPARKPGHSGRP